MTGHILEFWESQAEKHGTAHAASWGDSWAIALEVETIGAYVREGHDVLDVGCANGHATIQHLKKKPRSIHGIDFSEKMIREAEVNKAACGSPPGLTFAKGDVRHIEQRDQSFDLVYTTRTLINLPTWQEQAQGIGECLRVCKKGGTVVLSEGFWEPLVRLNAMRALVGLEPLVEHDFNRYLKRSVLEAHLKSLGHSFEAVDFSSVYYLGSRFVRELVTVPSDYPGYSNPVNEIFYRIEREYSGGGFGIQMAYVIRK
jgi:ubiquinone/menaquinone biosynthesis C-methylase UbiE